MSKITISKQGALSEFFKPISAISDIVSIKLYNDKAECLTRTTDNQLILYVSSSCIKSTDENAINIADSKNLEKLISSIDEDDFDIELNGNYLQYKSKSFKFKYHLLDQSLAPNIPLNIEKIKSFKTDVEFVIQGDALDKILKRSSIVSDVNKVYFYFEDGAVYAEIGDRAKHNLDNITLEIGESDFTTEDSYPVSLDCIRYLCYNKQEPINVGINTTNKVIVLELSNSKYIITTLVK